MRSDVTSPGYSKSKLITVSLAFLILFLFMGSNSILFNASAETNPLLSPNFELPFMAGEQYLCTKGYGDHQGKKDYYAVDFGMPEGTHILASSSGIVVGVEEGLSNTYPDLYSYGNFIEIDHDNGFSSFYAHLNSIMVTPGQYVNQGQLIGLSGNTGYSTGPHIHFRITCKDEPYCPEYISGYSYFRAGEWYTSNNKEGEGTRAVVSRIWGDNRYHTSLKLSQLNWDQANTVIIARGDDFADVLSGVPFAHMLGAPILLTPPDFLPELTFGEISRMDAKKAIILGGTAAVSSKVEETLRDMGLEIERINGRNRYETCELVARSMLNDVSEISATVVVNGKDFADALAIAPHAARTGLPILLVSPQGIPFSISSLIEELGTNKIIVVGGSSVVSDDVLEMLPGRVERIAGKTRHDTAIALAQYFGKESNTVYLAREDDFADALAGSLSAAKQGAIILYTNSTDFTELTRQYLMERVPGIENVILLGGRQAISLKIEDAVKDLFF